MNDGLGKHDKHEKKEHADKPRPHLEQIERSADRIRGELVETLQELERRRQHAMDIRAQIHEHARALTVAGISVGVGVATLLLVAFLRSRNRDERLRRERVRGLVRAWQHPHRLANQRPGKPFPVEIGRKVGLTIATVVASQLARRTAERMLPAKRVEQVSVPVT